jgi:hypothetical protein
MLEDSDPDEKKELGMTKSSKAFCCVKRALKDWEKLINSSHTCGKLNFPQCCLGCYVTVHASRHREKISEKSMKQMAFVVE